ncbi:hypothetical protein [Enterococcus caccae]|uniref:Uncharacterized protein n=1 Tax=Enterococcus caccae ATCC BAA-1240 TaxID=1158612 RepID=R3TVC6_9ENTE|nr:hypothetical protein [Enterococcus caccae]EOL45103.1 hypothetical protein UC7_01909 [Enterococcus caccae ATCC BAA-1240]EOT58510.1 hypothetical protein I580_02681 [Enterococcus caccae ATCC BAA-1240]
MKNKYKIFLLVCITLIIMVGCSGSKEIQKTWKAEDATDNVYSIEIKDKEITISNNKDTDKMDYKQNAVGTANGVKYYGLTIDNEKYSIIFPEKGNTDLALFLKIESDDYLDGTLVYAMNTKEQPSYKDYAEKYLIK